MSTNNLHRIRRLWHRHPKRNCRRSSVQRSAHLDKFVQGTCSKCAIKYLCHKDNPSDLDNQIGVAVPFDDGQKDDSVFFPYPSSLCHPLFIPKYSYWERVAGGVANLVALCISMITQKWRNRELPGPTFTSNDEVCVKCKQSPGSDGCMTIHSKYQDKIVDHTNLVENEYERYLDVGFN